MAILSFCGVPFAAEWYHPTRATCRAVGVSLIRYLQEHTPVSKMASIVELASAPGRDPTIGDAP